MPAAQRLEGFGKPHEIIEPGEALHARTPSHQIRVVRRARLRRGGVGFRDRTAQRDARVEVDPSSSALPSSTRTCRTDCSSRCTTKSYVTRVSPGEGEISELRRSKRNR